MKRLLILIPAMIAMMGLGPLQPSSAGDPAAANTGVSIDYIILLVRNNR